MCRHRQRRRRAGKILVIVAMLLPVLLLVLGLVLEGGLSMAAHGRLRNLADSVAQVVAKQRYTGMSDADAGTLARDFVRQAPGYASPPELTLNVPPASGAYQGDAGYSEVLLSQTLPPLLTQIFSADAERRVAVRAVAGAEAISSGARVIALDADAVPGLLIQGAGLVRIEGGVMVNSRGGGKSEAGDPVAGPAPAAALVGNNAQLQADDVQVAGGVKEPANFVPLNPSARQPLRTGAAQQADPLASLPVPTVDRGLDATERGRALINNGSAQVEGGNTVVDEWALLKPGIYETLEITGGKVRLESGIYVIRPKTVGVLRIVGGQVDSPGGVMFYVTGHDFDPQTGLPDAGDVGETPENTTNSRLASVIINAEAGLEPLANLASPYRGILVFQRRANNKSIDIQGQGGLPGAVYAKRAELKVSGKGSFRSQFIVGQLSKTGVGDVLIDCPFPAPTAAHRVFLVE